jgi:hypothetical protein
MKNSASMNRPTPMAPSTARVEELGILIGSTLGAFVGMNPPKPQTFVNTREQQWL